MSTASDLVDTPQVFLFYVGIAIVGAVLLGASVVLGGHGGDVTHGDVHAGGHGGDATGPFSALLQFLSLRFWTYLLAFGGTTGVLLRRIAHVHEPLAALLALATGLAAATFSRVVLRRATGRSSSGTVRSGDLVGRNGAVVVPFARGHTGKVRVRIQNGDLDVLATTDDAIALDRHDDVMILEVRDGTALVTRGDASTSDPSGRNEP